MKKTRTIILILSLLVISLLIPYVIVKNNYSMSNSDYNSAQNINFDTNETTSNSTTTTTEATETEPDYSGLWIWVFIISICVIGTLIDQSIKKSKRDSHNRYLEEQRRKKELEDEKNNAMKPNVSVNYKLGTGIIGWDGYELKLPKMNWPPPRSSTQCNTCNNRKGRINCVWCGDPVCNNCVIKLGVPSSTGSKVFRVITGIGVDKYYPFCPRCRDFGRENKLF